jgi:two-component system chemotaxis response regulator CheY
MGHDYSAIRFLIVDDMTTMRMVISRHIKGLGATHILEADDASTGRDVLQKSALSKEPIEFVICDWNMPGMTGLDLLKFCRQDPTYKNIAFLMVSAESEMSEVSEAIAAGVDNYVFKPFSAASLIDKIDLVYKKRFKKS